MIPSAGQLVGPYEILGRLGSGGMGLVFSAWDSRLQRDVAIKILREEYADRDTRERFLHEARAASGLNHPNICTVFDMGEQGGDPYLVMELLKGETLRSRIIAGPMSAQDVVHAATEIADALAAAHARGVIHRDIKPANIFLVDKPTGGWQAKVLDFGLAKIELGDGLEHGLEMAELGLTVGTVSYMSPEQARGEALDGRSDLFALGVVMYEMATGRVPFRGATSALVFVQLLEHPPEPLRQANPTISAELDAIILRLLAKERETRFQSAAEVVQALRLVDLKKAEGTVNEAAGVFDGRSGPVAVSAPPAAGFAESPSGRALASASDDRLLRPERGESLSPVGFKETPEPQADGLADGELPSHSVARRNPSFDYIAPEERTPVATLPAATTKRSGGLMWIAAVFVLLLIAGIAYWKRRGGVPVHHGPVSLMLAAMVNESGEKGLDGVVLEGLRMELSQSPKIALTDGPGMGSGSTGPGTPEVSVAAARQVGAAAGATCVLYGDVRKSGGGIVVSVGVYDVASGDELLKAKGTAASAEEIAETIDRLAIEVRAGLGESKEEVARSSVPLARDATSDIESLQAYVTGLTEERGGNRLGAIAAFQHAVELEPMFTQAWTRLAVIYRGEHAEIAAADAAMHARTASSGASERTVALATASYELNATADYPRAMQMLDQLVGGYPADVSIQAERALLLRLQGKFPEAVEAAETALARDPHDLKASGEAEYAMVALNRVQAAGALETEAAGHRLGDPELKMIVGFLSGVPDGRLQDKGGEWVRAQMLDATGQMDIGLEVWRSAEMGAKTTPALASAAAYAMSQAALDRALTGDCGSVSALVNEASALPRGQGAIFASGMALGLCGDLDGPRTALAALTTQYPQSFPAKSYYLANLMAVQQLRSGDATGALTTLKGAAQYDLLALTPYMRGLAHGAAGQWAAAIGDFQFVLMHRGAATLTSAPMYAMAQVGLARAYAASGDRDNSAAGYKAFAEMWKAADAGDPLLIEARKHSR